MFKLIFCFSEIPKTFICVRVRQVTFLCEDWKQLSVWSSVLFTVSTLEICEREAYRKKTVSNVPVLQQGLPFRAWPIYAGFTVDCHMIISKYLSLSHKPEPKS